MDLHDEDRKLSKSRKKDQDGKYEKGSYKERRKSLENEKHRDSRNDRKYCHDSRKDKKHCHDSREDRKHHDSREDRKHHDSREDRKRHDSRDDRKKHHGLQKDRKRDHEVDLNKQTNGLEKKRNDDYKSSNDSHKRKHDDIEEIDEEKWRRKNMNDKPKQVDEMLGMKTGGAYIPPAKLRMMQEQITDKSSQIYQRMSWEALKKSINGNINKVSLLNIGIVVRNLLRENLVRGRGLLCRALIDAQVKSPGFTDVYAAIIAVINSKFPEIGNLFLRRCVDQFKKSYRRNIKATCIASIKYIAHLVNQRVAHEIIALQILVILLETPTDQSVEIAIAMLKECGQRLTQLSSKGVTAIFEMLRNILYDGNVDKRVQYMIEIMYKVRKDNFKDFPAIVPDLDLIDESDQFMHTISLDEKLDTQDMLNVFTFDEEFLLNEDRYAELKKDILGGDDDDDNDEEEEESGESESEENEDDEETKEENQSIVDKTESNLIAFRRNVYLTINSSLDFEECAHKLMKAGIKPGEEMELCNMFIDCCAQQRTYEKFFGLLAERFCRLNRIYVEPMKQLFADSYNIVHRFDTNKLRNVAKFFAHLLFTDAISWDVLSIIRLNEEDTTSSSRVFIKILFQELCEYMGLLKLNDRLKDPNLEQALAGLFPKDNPKNTRFSINFFTSIGLGGLTDDLRDHLKT